MTGRLAGDNSRNITSLKHQIFVFLRNMAFLCGQKYRSALYAFRAEHANRCQSAAVCDAARRNNRNVYRIHNLRQQSHRRRLTNVSAGLHALCNDCIDAQTLHAARQRNRSDNRNHCRARLLPLLDILRRRACAGRDNRNLFVNHKLCDIVRIRAEQHDIECERLVRHALCLFHFFPNHFNGRRAARNDAETACIGDRSSQIAVCNPCHRTLKHRVFNM